jgi:DNA-binding NtrC family response regulator
MVMPTRLLVIDSDTQRRSLIIRTLARRFPNAITLEASDVKEAKITAISPTIDAVVGVASEQCAGTALIQSIRKADEWMPILIMDDLQYKEQLLSGGATAFLRREEWLLADSTLGRILKTTRI